MVTQNAVLVDGVFESLTSFEFRLVRGWNLDGFAGARVATGGCCASSDTEGAEADEADFVTGFQRTRDGVENTVYSLRGIRFGQFRAGRNGGNQIILVQLKAPFINSRIIQVRAV